jgi:hypothetical protein
MTASTLLLASRLLALVGFMICGVVVLRELVDAWRRE